MTPAAILDTPRTATPTLRFSYVLLFAIALNFLLANDHDQQRCIELAVLALGLLGALVTGQLARALQAVPLALRLAGMVLLALGACASIGTVAPARAMSEWAMFVMLGLSAIVVAGEFAVASATDHYRLLQTLCVVCGLYSLRVLLVYAATLAAGAPLPFQSLSVGFSNMRFLNHAQTGLLPLLILLIASSPRASWTRRGAFLVAAYWWSLIVFAEARATMLALAVGIAVAWLVRGRQARPLLGTMLATVLGGAFLYLLLYFVLPIAAGLEAYGLLGNILARSAADPISGRQFLWKRAAELIVHHPLLGVGPQHFAHYGADLATGAHPHDWLLQIAVEWGLPALLCVLFMLGVGARGLLRAGKSIAVDDGLGQATCAALVVAVAGIVVDSLFSGVLVMPQSQMVVALVIGVAAGWIRALQPPTPARASVTVHGIGAVLVMSAIGILVVVAGPDAVRKWEGGPLTPQEAAHNPDVHWPRLWEAGFF
jgi:putative inorganic carbon (hco3(-)) transporter